MLPKLQQSSLAQSLRRDNLASQIQCTSPLTQVKINSKASSANKATIATNHGRTTMPQKTRTHPSVTSPDNTSPRKNSKTPTTNPSTNLPSPDLLQDTQGTTGQGVRPLARLKKRVNFRSLYLNLVHSRKDRFLRPSSEGTTTEGICLFEWTIKTLCPSWCGRFQ